MKPGDLVAVLGPIPTFLFKSVEEETVPDYYVDPGHLMILLEAPDENKGWARVLSPTRGVKFVAETYIKVVDGDEAR
jgi:hypothetical protein